MANIQISEALFMDLAKYVFVDYPPAELRKACMDGLQAKFDKMAENELYHQSKVARTQEEREQALNDWYDKKGIPDAFRVIKKRN